MKTVAVWCGIAAALILGVSAQQRGGTMTPEARAKRLSTEQELESFAIIER